MNEHLELERLAYLWYVSYDVEDEYDKAPGWTKEIAVVEEAGRKTFQSIHNSDAWISARRTANLEDTR